MIGRCPKCGNVLYLRDKYYGCDHHDQHELEERSAIKQYDGGMTKRNADYQTLVERGLMEENA